ncbi:MULTISPECIES: hypothetical protein [Nocardia]|uniref:hypothetical protein n=1 Tax=Nocardia TaxID=1817 RepID=UPI002490B61D|nr:hypothetical protein [Nocardia sputorum]
MPLAPARPGDAPVRAAAGTAVGLFGVPLEGTETPGAFGAVGLPGLPGLPGVLRCGLPGLLGEVLGVGVVEAGVVAEGVVEAGVVDSSVVDAVVDSGVSELLSEDSVLDGVVGSSMEFDSEGFEPGDDVPDGFPLPLFVPRGMLPSSEPLGFVADAGRGITGTFVSDSMTTGA